MRRLALSHYLPLDRMWQITESEVATSSSDLAFQRIEADSDTAHGVVFIVAEQTKGRGRQGRNWTSRRGDGLYLSAIIRSHREVADWPVISFVASLSLYQALISLYPELASKLSLKWPNDLVTDSHKLAGILLEAQGGHIVIGCGVNLKNAPEIEHKGLRAGDLSQYIGGADIDRLGLGYRFLEQLAIQLAIFEKEGVSPIIASWSHHTNMIGKALKIDTQIGQLNGRCDGVDERGNLLLTDNSGNHHIITAGDVSIMTNRDGIKS